MQLWHTTKHSSWTQCVFSFTRSRTCKPQQQSRSTLAMLMESVVRSAELRSSARVDPEPQAATAALKRHSPTVETIEPRWLHKILSRSRHSPRNSEHKTDKWSKLRDPPHSELQDRELQDRELDDPEPNNHRPRHRPHARLRQRIDLLDAGLPHASQVDLRPDRKSHVMHDRRLNRGD